MIFGLGKSSNLSPSKIFQAYSFLAKTVIKIKAYDLCLGVFREFPDINYKNVAENILNGLLKELSKSGNSYEFSLKIIEEDQNKIGILRKTARQSLQKYKKNKCKIEMD